MALTVDMIFRDSERHVAAVANAGDCRVVVRRNSKTGVDPVDSTNKHPLVTSFESVDLNSKNTAEQERLKNEHPGEHSIIVGGRLFGKLMSTRGEEPPLRSRKIWIDFRRLRRCVFQVANQRSHWKDNAQEVYRGAF